MNASQKNVVLTPSQRNRPQTWMHLGQRTSWAQQQQSSNYYSFPHGNPEGKNNPEWSHGAGLSSSASVPTCKHLDADGNWLISIRNSFPSLSKQWHLGATTSGLQQIVHSTNGAQKQLDSLTLLLLSPGKEWERVGDHLKYKRATNRLRRS